MALSRPARPESPRERLETVVEGAMASLCFVEVSQLGLAKLLYFSIRVTLGFMVDNGRGKSKFTG